MDGGSTTVSISAGNKTRDVRINFLGNWMQNEPAKLREPARAIRVFRVIRGWFSDPAVRDSSDYERTVLDVAKLGDFVK